MEQQNRVTLLSEAEISDLYARPSFNASERKLYFNLTQQDHETLNKYKGTKSKCYFILQLGYFAAGRSFYDFNFEEVRSDLVYVMRTYFKGHSSSPSGIVARNTCMQQRSDILELIGYQAFSNSLLPEIEEHLSELLCYLPKGEDTLRALLGYFENKKIVIPTYRTLQDLFTRCFKKESARLSTIISSIPSHIQGQLETIIKNDGGISQLSVAKTDQRDFQYTAIKQEVAKAHSLSALYQFAEAFIPELKVSKNAIRYYATLTEQYSASRLRRLDKKQQHLHLICFVYHRYQEFMDNLICSFMVRMKQTITKSTEYAEEQASQHNSAIIAELHKVADFLKWFSSDQQDPEMRYREFSQKAFSILPKSQFPIIADFMEGVSFDNDAARWAFLARSSRMLSLYFRPILLTVNFSFHKEGAEIMVLINVLKKYYSKNRNPAELKRLLSTMDTSISQKILPYLKAKPEDTEIDPHRFEFYVYKKLFHQLDRGRLFCNESVSYCSLKHDLVPDAILENIEEIAKKFGYLKIPIYCDSRLDEALLKLDAAWKRTNQNIASGKNKGIKIETTEHGTTWNLLYDTDEKPDGNSFFSGLEQAEIGDIFKFVADKTGLWPAFTHIKSRYKKQETVDHLALLACILSDAFGFGIQKMATMSDINFNLLRSTGENFIRPETLKAANDILSNFVCKLPIFKVWNIREDLILGDADGQKFATTKHTIQSRYSQKYFGSVKGLSVLTLTANHSAVNAKVIAPSEHESHHLYDLIYNNTSEIDLKMITGDNHSVNQLNFVALDSINVEFVPSIKNIKAEAEKLYSSSGAETHEGLITPIGNIKPSLIKSQKKDILRVLLSLLLQENTQSVIIRKLSSHKRYSRLRAALWEYNKIFKSTHVLNLINDMPLRKSLRRARNRTESYHQLQGLFRKVYNGAFKGQKIMDNLVCSESSRLLANIIMTYNAIILNTFYENLCVRHREEKAKKMVAKISPIAWGHLSFTGKYLFKNSRKDVDIDGLVIQLEKQFKSNAPCNLNLPR
jgi:TnpA family transposase